MSKSKDGLPTSKKRARRWAQASPSQVLFVSPAQAPEVFHAVPVWHEKIQEPAPSTADETPTLPLIHENYDVVLVSVDQTKIIGVLRGLREIFGDSLKDLHDNMVNLPCVLVPNATTKQAKQLRKQIAALGADVVLVPSSKRGPI